MHMYFRSADVRFASIRTIRVGKGTPFFEGIDFESDHLLNFKFGPGFKPLCRTEHIFWTNTTFTSVQRLVSGKRVIVMKIYKLKDESKIPHHDVEIGCLRALMGFISSDTSPHIVMPIGRTIVPSDTAKILVGRQLPQGRYAVLLSEHADAALSTLIQRKKITRYQLKCMLFQVLYTLAAIHTILPNFRHNDLHASNVLIQMFNGAALQGLQPRGTTCVRYTHNGRESFVRTADCPMRALLWDFFYSSCNDLEILRATKHVGGVYSTQNRYYDAHKLLDSIAYLLPNMKGDLKEMIDLVVPDGLRCMPKKIVGAAKLKLGVERNEFMTCDQILELPFFDELHQTPTDCCIVADYTSNPLKLQKIK